MLIEVYNNDVLILLILIYKGYLVLSILVVEFIILLKLIY